MDKNIGLYIVLGFLLLCIVLSLDKKEGFVVVREDLFETECATGHDSCTVFLSGQEGVECADPSNKNLYNIPSTGSKFTGSDFNMNPTSCSASAYANGDPLDSQECDSEGEPYTLTGCSAYCTKPNVHPEYNIINPPVSIRATSVISPIHSVPTGDIVCADGYTPTIDTCVFKKDGSVTSIQSEMGCSGDFHWFGQNDGIKIYCDQPGGTYNIMGCEASCYPRTGDHIGDYLINTPDISSDDDYFPNKERIETMGNRTSTSLGDKIIHDRFPYSESDDSVFAPNDTFNVVLHPESGWIFRDDGDSDTTEPCVPNAYLSQNKYFVNGLYPDCDSTIEECLNFNIVYNLGSDDTPKTLEELRDKLPTENIFPQGSEPDKNTDEGLADLNKYKNALYYFRRFRNSDLKDEIEAQIRCDIDPTSDFHCSFTSNN